MRELVIHTGLDAGLLGELAGEMACNQPQLLGQGISLQPGEAFLAAALRNDWTAWRWRERRRLWKPWRRGDHVWTVAHGLVHPLLQERRFGRLQRQTAAMGFRMAVVVHLLDGREQLARDYARALISLRFCGSLDDYVDQQLEQHAQRYRLDQLFEPLLEWLGARGLRFVRHSSRPGGRLPTTWDTLDTLGGAGPRGGSGGSLRAPLPPPVWRSPEERPATWSLRRVRLAQELLQHQQQPPRGRQREQLRRRLEERLAQPHGLEPTVESWADVLQLPGVPSSFCAAQERLGLKVWGLGWPDTASSTALARALATPPRRRRRQARRRSSRRSG
ncbi:conserved protein of unknown function [Cyanobium sp. NIES-981]|nr:conserved protein of unknown function [Cyanobium sp. NIES-981]